MRPKKIYQQIMAGFQGDQALGWVWVDLPQLLVQLLEPIVAMGDLKGSQVGSGGVVDMNVMVLLAPVNANECFHETPPEEFVPIGGRRFDCVPIKALVVRQAFDSAPSTPGGLSVLGTRGAGG
jgi:hypothetical protein